MGMSMGFIRNRFGFTVGACRAAMLVISLFVCTSAFAETQVYLLRGWFGVFSAGMDALASDLASKGIKADTIGHLAWKATVTKIASDRAAGKTGALVLVGHSQGANNVIEMARELEKKKVPVDLLVTLAPFMQDPVPGNVVRALNYYQAGGWGAPLSGDKNFRGKISNIDMGGEVGTFHINIDKSSKVQSDIAREILAVSRARQTAPGR
jgi:hypothetical protein